jgi:hypothetical protein
MRIGAVAALSLVPPGAHAVMVEVTSLGDCGASGAGCTCPGSAIPCTGVAYDVTVTRESSDQFPVRDIQFPLDCSEGADIVISNSTAGNMWHRGTCDAKNTVRVQATGASEYLENTESTTFQITLIDPANRNAKVPPAQAHGPADQFMLVHGKSVPTIIPNQFGQAPAVSTWGVVVLVALMVGATWFLVRRRRVTHA